MTEGHISTEPRVGLARKLRAKAWLARWSLMLWACFAVAISVASWRLFPGVHFWVDGGLQGIKLVASVDLVLGPILFMLVANPAKSPKARLIDASTLFTVQLLAMSWGGWQVYTQRPVAVSYLPGGFAVPLIADDFARQNVNPEILPASRLNKLPAFYVNIPSGGNSLQVLSELVSRNVAVSAQAALLQPLFEHEQEVFARADLFLAYWAGEGSSYWQAWSSRHGGKAAKDCRFITFVGRYGNAVLVLDLNNQLLGYIQLPEGNLPAALRGN